MIKRILKLSALLVCFITVFSCKTSELNNEFDCTINGYSNLKSHKDFKKNFSLDLPENWKVKYYFDDVLSSISAADTTISITKSAVIDASFILDFTKINTDFIRKIKSDNQQLELTELQSKQITFLNKNSYYNLAKGNKLGFTYHILNVFTEADRGFLHLKTEIYGDSLVTERLCKSIQLFEDISIE